MNHPYRFDPHLLADGEPFELDVDNLPHLAKHTPFTHEDLVDAWVSGEPLFVAAPHGPADWLMLAELAGEVLVIPLARARSGSPRQARPIGIYRAGAVLSSLYRMERP